MNKYEKARIGNLCQIIKGETGIASAEPGQYPLVTTGSERKTAKTFQFDTEAVCIPLVSSSGHGKKSLNYVHYQKGKFALGTILAAVIPRDPNKISAAFLHRYLQFYKDRKIVPLMKGAANVSLAIKDIAKIEIPVPPIEEQTSFINLFNKANGFSAALLSESVNQSDFLSRLRQTILQEAIEGKLTVEWRKKNPVRKGDPDTDAAALLEKIKSEKQKLIAEGKIKKEKPLAHIGQKKIPIDLPQGWVWCRPIELGQFVGGGTPNTNVKEYWNGDIPWITPKDMKVDYIETSELKITTEGVRNSNANILPENTPIFVVRSGILKRTVPVSITRARSTINQDLKAWMLLLPEMADYLRVFVKGSEKRILSEIVKKGMTVESFDFERFKWFLIPLPPLAEQTAIVERVNQLLSMVDKLEEQVTERRVHAEELMQTVLREAFEGK